MVSQNTRNRDGIPLICALCNSARAISAVDNNQVAREGEASRNDPNQTLWVFHMVTAVSTVMVRPCGP